MSLTLFIFGFETCVFALDFRYQERAVYSFLTSKLMDKNGGIYSNYYRDHPKNKNAGVNHDILSESMGLFMEYLYLYDDRKGFKKQVKLLKERFLSDVGLVSWCVRESGKVESSNALIDDLRIVRYLLLAGKKWKNTEYIDTAIKIAKAVAKYNSYKGYLVDGASWEKGFLFGYNVVPAKRVSIPYLDLYTMKIASDKVDAFSGFFIRSAGVVIGSIDNRSIRMFFYPDRGRYSKKQADPINFLNTVIYLVEAGVVPYELLDYIESRLLLPRLWVDNAGVYALMAELFSALGDKTKAELAINKMVKHFAIKDGPLAGGIGYLEKGRYHVYAFDNLLAMNAIRRYELAFLH